MPSPHPTRADRASHRRVRASFVVLTCVVTLFAEPAAGEDTAALPAYTPLQATSGTIRIWGNDHMGRLLQNWEAGFRKYHPDVRFEDTLKGTASAQYGLQEWVADLALMGRQLWPYEYYGTFRRSLIYPAEIAVATGSYDVPGKSYALAILVHKDNPLSRLTVRQIDAVFGAQRTGGWQQLDWHPEVARAAGTNIRTWEQLGLTGEWKDKPIHPYGPPLLAPGAISYFQTRVMGGADTWNEDLREYEDRQQMVDALGDDRYGIAYTGIRYKTPRVKAVAVADKEGGPFVELTRATVASRAYPLSRLVYLSFTVDTPTGELANPPVSPKVREFLRYVLSREGQADVAREGDYLPLAGALARTELQKLEAPDLTRIRKNW